MKIGLIHLLPAAVWSLPHPHYLYLGSPEADALQIEYRKKALIASSIAIYYFPVRKQSGFLGQVGHQALCLRQVGFLCHVQICPPAHLWYI